jgi:translation initiation factor IF-2
MKIEEIYNLQPPIVSILGHVDHGKTSLLDFIGNTNIAKREVGGITQNIGASQVKTKDGKLITFIDTPGHSAFNSMRQRGVNVADVCVLVVAGNEGVKPQTVEAIDFIKQAKTPVVIAITKADLSSHDPENVKDQLKKADILVEGKGGNIPVIEVSVKTGQGVDELLEMVSLVYEMHFKKTERKGLEGYVIETNKDNRGVLVTAVLKNGRLNIGDEILVGKTKAKVKGMFSWDSKPIRQVDPGMPVQILGFQNEPEIGMLLRKFEQGEDSDDKKEVSGKRVMTENRGKLNFIIKTKSVGGLEAALQGIPKEVGIINAQVGEVSEGDIFLAKSAGSDARIFAFEVKVNQRVRRLAETEGVKIEYFEIIYKLFERIEELIKEEEDEIKGKAVIVAIFPYENRKVAGCKVVSGVIKKEDKIKVFRDDKELGSVKILSMRKEKRDVVQVAAGEEFGVIFEGKLDFIPGDMVISIR